MTITCQVVTNPMRNLLRARNAHVIGLLRACYVTHVTRYVVIPRNSLYYVHVIDLVWLGLAIATTRGQKSRRAGRHCWPTDAARARAPNGVGGLAIPAARPAPTTELSDTVLA